VSFTRRSVLLGTGLACASCASPPVVPDARPGRRVSGVLTSEARGGRRCGWTIVWPPGPRRDLPVAVVLHGRGNDHGSAFSAGYLALDRYLAQVVRRGTAPYALASIDGGEAYWHTRSDGDDPAAMVVDEFLPLLGRHELDTDRLGFLGWSMGGYGALHSAACSAPRGWPAWGS
jgi:S-formylglutathione hydrolase FrmB